MHEIQIHRSHSTDIALLKLPGITKAEHPIEMKSMAIKRAHTLNFRSQSMYNNFQIPEYNLYEISAAEDGDGIVKQTVETKIALMFKEGYTIDSLNEKTKEYIKGRLRQIELAQRYPMFLLFRDLGADLIRYHNAFLVKVRIDSDSGGNIRRARGTYQKKDFKPIAAYFRMAPETIRIRTDKFGNPTHYLQETPDGRRSEFPAENVIHIYHNRRAGFNIACPGMWPGINDIRSLRRLEEYLELLTEQYIFPLFTLSIGTDEYPVETLPNGDTEVEVWSDKIRKMDISAGLVFSHRFKLDVIGFNKVIPIETYLDYFKQRVYTSMGISPLDAGETDTANRSTADNASSKLTDGIKAYQQTFKYFVEFEILQELLLEKYDATILHEENMAMFSFNEIDTMSMMKKQNHNVLMYTMGGMTEDEMRTHNNMPKVSDKEREKMYLHVYEKPKMELQGEQDKALVGAKNQAASRQQPSNQHGKSTGPTKRKSSMTHTESHMLDAILNDISKDYVDITNLRLLNWFFGLDYAKTDLNFCVNNFSRFSHSLRTVFGDMQENTIGVATAKELLYSHINEIINSEETDV